MFAPSGQVDTFVTFLGMQNLSKSVRYSISPLDGGFVVQYDKLYPLPASMVFLATGLALPRCDSDILAPGMGTADRSAVGGAVWLVLTLALAWSGVRRVLRG